MLTKDRAVGIGAMTGSLHLDFNINVIFKYLD